MKGKLAAITVLAALSLPGSAQGQQDYPTHMLKKIHHNRDETWDFQDKVGHARTPYHFWAEHKCGNKACRFAVLKIWRHRHRHWHHVWKKFEKSMGVPVSVRNTLMCIHPFEAPKVNGEPVWSSGTGGLGYVSSPGSYNVGSTDKLTAQYGDSWYNWPAKAQIEFGYQLVKAYGYRPWSTAYHCT